MCHLRFVKISTEIINKNQIEIVPETVSVSVVWNKFLAAMFALNDEFLN